jgi:cytochrome P450
VAARRAPPLTAPAALPLAGHGLAFLRDKPGFLSRCRDAFGDCVRLDIGGPTWLLHDPFDIKHVLVDAASCYEKTSKLTSPRGRALSGEGLHTATGADHLLLRRMAQPLFHRRIIAEHVALVEHATERMLARWRGQASVDAWTEMLGVSQQVMLAALFGPHFIDAAGRFAAAVTVRRAYIEHFFTSLLPGPEHWPVPIVWRYRGARRVMHEVIAEQIAWRRREGHDADDWLSMLMGSTGRDGTLLNDTQLRDEAVTLTSTGYETVAAALAWSCHLLARHPEVQEAVRVEALLAGDGDTPLRTRVLNEVMRLYPPTWLFIREPQVEDRLPSGATVRPGEKLYLCPYTMHRHPHWWPDPDRFDPTRFDDAAMRTRPRFTYFPFGGGARQCLGEPFARMEVLVVLGAVLRRFRLRPDRQEEVRMRPGIVLEPRDGVRVALEPLT